MHILNKIQNWTQSGPKGNDKQVMGYAIAGGLSSLLGGYLASQQPKTDFISPEQIKAGLSGTQGLTNQYGQMQQEMAGIGREQMDPRSAMNQRQLQMLRGQGASQMALQNLLSQRQAAAMGQSSGITAAQNRAAQAGIGQQTGNLYNQALLQQQQAGIGTLGTAGSMLANQQQMQLGLDENVTQAMIAQNQQKRQQEMAQNQQWGSLLGGLGSGLMGMGQPTPVTNYNIGPQ
jgi:hypothetical protein